MVLGSTFSAVWIVIANGWQHTSAGFELVGEAGAVRAQITDFWAMIFNPSSMHRLGHVLLGSLLQGAFFAMSVFAFLGLPFVLTYTGVVHWVLRGKTKLDDFSY